MGSSLRRGKGRHLLLNMKFTVLITLTLTLAVSSALPRTRDQACDVEWCGFNCPGTGTPGGWAHPLCEERGCNGPCQYLKRQRRSPDDCLYKRKWVCKTKRTKPAINSWGIPRSYEVCNWEWKKVNC